MKRSTMYCLRWRASAESRPGSSIVISAAFFTEALPRRLDTLHSAAGKLALGTGRGLKQAYYGNVSYHKVAGDKTAANRL
jgi:hypothetical protein